MGDDQITDYCGLSIQNTSQLIQKIKTIEVDGIKYKLIEIKE